MSKVYFCLLPFFHVDLLFILAKLPLTVPYNVEYMYILCLNIKIKYK